MDVLMVCWLSSRQQLLKGDMENDGLCTNATHSVEGIMCIIVYWETDNQEQCPTLWVNLGSEMYLVLFF